MIKQFLTGKLTSQMHWRIFKTVLLFTILLSLSIWGFLHLIFYGYPFEAKEEALILSQTLAAAFGMAAIISLALLAVDFISKLSETKKVRPVPVYGRLLSAAAILLIILMASCNEKYAAGIRKDASTGLVTSYKNMEPEKVMLVMNDEVLNHTDIPIGESFLLINNGVDGMKVKDGKVSLGCALKITDKKGKVVLKENDLFEGHDVFNEKEARLLKCIVNTGEPMQTEENYDVVVKFWDKFGEGSIENKVTIRSIDMP